MTSRPFGVELEVAGIHDNTGRRALSALAAALRSEGLRASPEPDGGPDEPMGGRWRVAWDATAGHDGEGGPELVSPPMERTDGIAQIEAACRALHKTGATVSDHCALHVHHDAADLTAEQMLRLSALYRTHQRAISALLPPSRRRNRYAMPETGLSQDTAEVRRIVPHERPGVRRTRISYAMSGGSRHRAVNWLAYACHGTVEFRQHHGTLDADEIAYWVVFTRSLVEAAVEGRQPSPLLSPSALRRRGLDPAAARAARMWADLSRHMRGDPLYRRTRALPGAGRRCLTEIDTRGPSGDRARRRHDMKANTVKKIIEMALSPAQAERYADLARFVGDILANPSQSMLYGRAVGLLLSTPDRMHMSVRITDKRGGRRRYSADPIHAGRR